MVTPEVTSLPGELLARSVPESCMNGMHEDPPLEGHESNTILEGLSLGVRIIFRCLIPFGTPLIRSDPGPCSASR